MNFNKKILLSFLIAFLTACNEPMNFEPTDTNNSRKSLKLIGYQNKRVSISSEMWEEYFGTGGSHNQVEDLDLTGARFDHSLLEKLPATLKILVLANMTLKDDDIKNISHLNELEKLDLTSNYITDEGIHHLVNNSQIDKLTTLILANNEIRDKAVSYIVKSPNMSNLTELDLSYNEIGSDTHLCKKLAAELSDLKKLEKLNLGKTDLGKTLFSRDYSRDVWDRHNGEPIISIENSFENLIELNLHDNFNNLHKVGRALTTFKDMDRMPKLKKLYLYHSEIKLEDTTPEPRLKTHCSYVLSKVGMTSPFASCEEKRKDILKLIEDIERDRNMSIIINQKK